MKTITTYIIIAMAIFMCSKSKAQLNFFPEDPLQDPPNPVCVTAPYSWVVNPAGSTNKCFNEDFNVSGMFNDPDNLGQLYWVNGITNAVMATGQTLLSTGLTQTTTIHCEYRIPTGNTCSGKYVANYVVNISNCTPTPIIDAVVPNDITLIGSEFITSGGAGKISIVNMQGLEMQSIKVSSSQKNYEAKIPYPGIYIVNVSYEGKNSTSKMYIQ